MKVRGHKDANKKIGQKNMDASRDNSAIRGFSTYQRIDIEHLNVQQEQMLDSRIQTSIVALSIEESPKGDNLMLWKSGQKFVAQHIQRIICIGRELIY